MKLTVLLAMVVVMQGVQSLAVPIAGENDYDESQKETSDLESDFLYTDNSTESSRARSNKLNSNRALIQTDCECGRKLAGTRIVGGATTEINEYPWQAALVRYPDEELHCGGSLITDRHVLTAAHCVENMAADEMRVRLREFKLSDLTETNLVEREIESFLMHAKFDSTVSLDYDIAIITLMTPVTIKRTLLPVCLANNPKKTYANQIATVTGWGAKAETGPSSDKLREVDLPVLSNKFCKKETNYVPEQITGRMICAGEEGKSSCFGDSGGPLVYEDNKGRYDQIGLVSFHVGECAEDGSPSVFSRITKYLKWIERHTQDGIYCDGFKFP